MHKAERQGGSTLIGQLYPGATRLIKGSTVQICSVSSARYQRSRPSEKFPRIEVLWIDDHTVGLRQYYLIKKLLLEHGMQWAMETNYPLASPDDHINKAELLNEDRAGKYLPIVERLLYVTLWTIICTSMTVGIFKTRVISAGKKHFNAFYRVLDYPRKTYYYMLTLCPEICDQILAYSEACWGTVLSNRRQDPSGIIIYYGAPPIHVSTCSRYDTAISLPKAKFVSLFDVTRQMFWLRYVNSELKSSQCTKTIYQISSRAIQISNVRRLRHISQTKPIDIQQQLYNR